MLSKFLSWTIALLLCTGANAQVVADSDPFSHKLLGECFADIEKFVEQAYGEVGKADPNVVVTRRKGWIWIIDQTAGRNYAWHLLRREREGVCFRVFVPAAAHVSLKREGEGYIVEAHIGPDGAYPPKYIKMTLPRSASKAVPLKCYKLPAADSNNLKLHREMDCSKIYE